MIVVDWCIGIGEILWANNTLLEMLGYSANEYIGHSIREVSVFFEVKNLS